MGYLVSFSTKKAGPLLMTNSQCALCGCFLARCVYGARLEYRQVPTTLIIPTGPLTTPGALPWFSGVSNIADSCTSPNPTLSKMQRKP